MPKDELSDDELLSFIDDLEYAKKKNLDVLIYASGTYKGINGKIINISAGTIVMRSMGKRVRLKISDIRRIEIFENMEGGKNE